MNFLKKALTTVQSELKVIQQKGKQTIEKIEQKIQEKVDSSKNQHEKDLIEITDRIYWMNFPTPEKIVGLSKYLNDKFKQSYYIWNVSEHKYEVFPFNEQVADHNMAGYPNPSLQEIFMICKSIISWLNSDSKNIAIIHCQNTRGRSALIISCLLSLNKTFIHPGEALTYFCKQTKTKDMKILFPSQSLYLNYFANILNGVKLNNKPLLLKKIVFSEVPKIIRKDEQGNEELNFRPYLQVFKESNIIYNSLGKEKVASYSQNDMSLWFDLDGVEVSEDILFRCKHYHTNQLRYPVFRMMIHTGFTHDNVLRLLKTDIDFTSNVWVSDDFFIDIIFAEIPSDKLQSSSKIINTKEKSNNNKDKINDDDEEQKTNLEYVVDECRRKISEDANMKKGINKNKEQEEEDEHDKEIQRILQKSNNLTTFTSPTNSNSSVQSTIPSFSIGMPEFGSAEKNNKKNSVDEDDVVENSGISDKNNNKENKIKDDNESNNDVVIDDKKSDSHTDEIDDDEYKIDDKQKASKLLFDTIHEDQDLDHQEIDDYLDNLEKSDEEL